MSAFSRRVFSVFSTGVTYNQATGRLSVSGGGGSGGATVQNVAFAASITPDPTLGEVFVLGQITGAFSILNPVTNTPGQVLEFHFQQGASIAAVPTWGAYFQPGANALISQALASRSTIRYRCISSTYWALETSNTDTNLAVDISVYKGVLVAEVVGTTKVPRLVNRTGGNWTVNRVYVDVDTAPTGTLTVVVRKNGSATGQVSCTVAAAAFTGNVAAAFSLVPGDYLQAWVTVPAGSSDASITATGVVG